MLIVGLRVATLVVVCALAGIPFEARRFVARLGANRLSKTSTIETRVLGMSLGKATKVMLLESMALEGRMLVG